MVCVIKGLLLTYTTDDDVESIAGVIFKVAGYAHHFVMGVFLLGGATTVSDSRLHTSPKESAWFQWRILYYIFIIINLIYFKELRRFTVDVFKLTCKCLLCGILRIGFSKIKITTCHNTLMISSNAMEVIVK